MGNVKEISWEEFRATGLLTFVNTFLHIFGLAIVLEVNDDESGKKLIKVFPARVNYRGFEGCSITNAYIKLSKFMAENAIELEKEVNE
jgi:hypothetical protein